MKLPRMIGACVIVVMIAVAQADAGERQYDFQQKMLSNGLRVITLEDFSCPKVAVQVWYHVGSKDEDQERQGFAHMFEHMMFKGTDRVASKDHFELIRRTGGDCNAFTSFDNTTYVNELPSNQLELALWLEAERMVFLRIDDESFYTERKVVEEERRLGTNRPYGKVPEQVLPAIFRTHAYRWLPIGQIPHLRAAKIGELEAFWSRFYVPANATLVIVGAVKNTDAQSAAEKYFGWIPKCPPPPRTNQKEAPQTSPREIKISEEKGPVPIVGFAFRGVPQNHADAVALGMLMTIIGGGESSRLNEELVKKQKICQAAIAGAFSLEDDGLCGAGAVMLPLIEDKERVLAEIDAQLKKVVAEGVTQRELDKVRNQDLKQLVTGALTVASKANLLGQAALIYGDPERVNKRIDEIRAVTLADMQRVAKTYLTEERRTTVRVEPSLGGMLKNMLGMGKNKDDEDEGAAPSSAPGENKVAEFTGCKARAQRPAEFPAKPPIKPLIEDITDAAHTDFSLSNGLKVVVIENREVPYVTMTIGLKYGAWADDPAKPGVASMALGLLTKGTAKHTAAQFAEETEFNAVSVGGSASQDVSTINATCVADKAAMAAEYLAEVVLTPTFPAEEFKIAKKQMEMGLMISSKEAAYMADREYRRKLYGDHPYSRTPTGEIEDLRRIKAEDLAAWWKKFARPDMAVLYVAGDVKADAIKALAEKHFAGWKSEGAAPTVELAKIPQAGATHIFLHDRPGSVQSQIRVGHTSITREDPNYNASRVVSQILGGGFNSRLNEAIRVKKGLTYGARGGFSAQRLAGEFQASTFSKTANTAEAVQVLLDEVKRMRDTKPSDEEAEIARSYMVGSFAGARETPQATVGDLWMLEYNKLPADYFRKALAAYKKTTPDDIQRLSQSLIQMDRLTIVVVGDAKKLKEPLEKIAPVTVAPTDADKAAEPDKAS